MTRYAALTNELRQNMQRRFDTTSLPCRKERIQHWLIVHRLSGTSNTSTPVNRGKEFRRQRRSSAPHVPF